MDLEKGMKVGNELLNGKGLNHSAFARELLNKDKIDQTDRNKTKKLYTAIFDGLQQENGKAMYQDGHDWFLKQEKTEKACCGEDCEPLKVKIAELEGENARLNGLVNNLKAKIAELSDIPIEKPIVLKSWKYNWGTGEAKLFEMDKVKDLGKEWHEGPKPK